MNRTLASENKFDDVVADNRPFSPGAIPHGGRYSIIRTALRLAAHYGGASAVESSAHETSRVTTLPFSPRWLTKRRSFDQPSAAPIDSTNLRSESVMKSSKPRKLQAHCKIDRRRQQRVLRDDMNGFDLDLHASQRLIARCCADRHTQSRTGSTRCKLTRRRLIGRQSSLTGLITSVCVPGCSILTWPNFIR